MPRTLNKRRLPLALLLIATACSSAPDKAISAAERERAVALVDDLGIALYAAIAAGKVRPDDVQMATAQLAELRAAVANTEEPASWRSVMRQITAFGVTWALAGQSNS